MPALYLFVWQNILFGLKIIAQAVDGVDPVEMDDVYMTGIVRWVC